MASPSSAHLLSQPPEVIHAILVALADPADLARLSQTCRQLRDSIANDYLLWKRQYLGNFDCPASHIGNDTADAFWQARLKEVVRVGKILEAKDVGVKNDEASLDRVCSTAAWLLTESTARPDKNWAFLARHFKDEANVGAFLARSSLFEHARYPDNAPASTEALRQASARLFVYYGLEIEPRSPASTASAAATAKLGRNAGVRPVHPFARSRVYDLRRYKESNRWGPFLDDGSDGIDWEKVQCILIDILCNLRLATCSQYSRSLFNTPFRGLAPNSFTSAAPERRSMFPRVGRYRIPLSSSSSQPFTDLVSLASAHHPPSRPPPDGEGDGGSDDSPPSLAAQDPYGVTGTWMRIVCFLDYGDLYEFNFESGPIDPAEARPPIETREALRLIRLQLRVTKIEWPEGDVDANQGSNGDDTKGKGHGRDGNSNARPIVHFEGTSKSTHMPWDPNANSRIQGTVQTTRSGAVRWTTMSIIHGQERWRSEGVQIGGINSARGVLGNWFDKDYDAHGPAGPTYFWKVSDDTDGLPASGVASGSAAAAVVVGTGQDHDDDDDDEGDDDYVDDDDDDDESGNQVGQAVVAALGMGMANSVAGPFELVLWGAEGVVGGGGGGGSGGGGNGEDNGENDGGDDGGAGAAAGLGTGSVLFIID